MNGIYDKPSDETIRIKALKAALKLYDEADGYVETRHVLQRAAEFEKYIRTGSVG